MHRKSEKEKSCTRCREGTSETMGNQEDQEETPYNFQKTLKE
jgi:hypothetical protein